MKKISIGFRFLLDFRAVAFRAAEGEENAQIELYISRLRNLLEALDRLNSRGIMVKAVWCAGGDFTYNQVMKKRCPDLLDHIRERVAVGFDEIHLYPWNDALLPLMVPSEMSKMMIDEKSDIQGSGVLDLFPSVEPYMPLPGGLYSPALLSHLSNNGIEGISFNIAGLDSAACSDLTEKLTFSQKYNPIWLTRTGSKEKTILIPSLSGADVINWGGLKKMVSELRQKQMKESKISDLYLLFDEGLDSHLLFGDDENPKTASDCYFENVVSEAAVYPFLAYSTPVDYLKTHTVRGIFVVDRDVLVGHQGVLSPWADKWESRQIWGRIERSRIYCDKAIQTARETGKRKVLKTTMDYVFESEDHRYPALAQTSFGPSTLSTHKSFYDAAYSLALQSEKSAQEAYRYACSQVKKKKKEISTDKFKEALAEMVDQELTVGESSIENRYLKIDYNSRKGAQISFKDFFKGKNILNRFAVRYAGKLYTGKGDIEYISTSNGQAQMLVKGRIRVRGNLKPIVWQHLYSLKVGLPYLYLSVEAEFPPSTKRKGSFLEEIMPSEFVFPQLTWRPHRFKIWKDSMLSGYEQQLSQGDYFEHLEKEQVLHSQVTRNWIAYGSAGYGLLLGQKHSEDTSFAFCPIKVQRKRRQAVLSINPMGCYQYEAVHKKFQSLSARLLFDRHKLESSSSAPSYEGKKLKASLFVSPFKGNMISEKIIEDCVAFSTNLTLAGAKNKELEVTG